MSLKLRNLTLQTLIIEAVGRSSGCDESVVTASTSAAEGCACGYLPQTAQSAHPSVALSFLDKFWGPGDQKKMAGRCIT